MWYTYYMDKKPQEESTSKKCKLKDGNYSFEKIISHYGKLKAFTSERAMGDYIEINIAQFTIDILQDKYISHKRESCLTFKAFGANIPRADFLIEGENSTYIVEVKNPKNNNEVTRGIGQILDYATIYGKPCKLFMVTSKHDERFVRIVKRYKLPIEYVWLHKGVYFKPISLLGGKQGDA